MLSIKNDLFKTINKYGIGDEFEAFLVCKEGDKIIKEFCEGRKRVIKLAVEVQVVKYLKQTQTLEVKITDFLLGQQIRANQKEIIYKINQALKREAVKKLRYRI